MQGFWWTKYSYGLITILIAGLLVMAWWRYASQQVGLARFENFYNTKVVVAGVIVADPDVRPAQTQLIINSEQLPGLILVLVPQYPVWRYGDRVVVSGQLVKPKNFTTDTNREFDYQTYLAVRNVGAILDRPQISLAKRAGYSVTGTLFGLKHSFVRNITRAISEPGATLAAGITVGERRALSKELLGYFQVTSLIHIVVLSGYNLAVIALGLMWLGQKLSRRWQISVAAVGAILFSIMVGGGASVMRALVMGLIGLFAKATGRNYDATRALIVAAIVMTVWNPIVVLDVGFELSFLATIGVLHVARWWDKKLSWVTEKFGLREIMATTLGAQTAVLPLLLYFSGIVSLTALPANILVTPMVPLAMLLTFMAGMVGFVSNFLALLVGGLAQLALSYIIKVTTFFALLPFSSVVLPPFSGWWVVAIYFISLVILGWKKYIISHARKI